MWWSRLAERGAPASNLGAVPSPRLGAVACAAVPDLTVTVDAVVAGGAGLGREPSGRVVFVEGGLPGERVRVAVDEQRRDYARGRAIAILVESPDRVVPPCPFVAAGCGGCGWQHVAHDAQLRLKEAIVADALRRVGGWRTLPPISTSHPGAGGRRTTVRMGLAEGRPAFRTPGGGSLVPVDACLVSHPRISEIIGASAFPGADEVLIRVGAVTGDALVLVSPGNAAAAATVPDGVAVATVGDGAHIHEVVAGHRFRITDDAFFQAGPDQAAALVEAVRTAAGDLAGRRVVDAYGGVGLFARAVAAAGGAATVEVVEADPVAADDARHNLGSGARVVRRELRRWSPSPADVVIADPARPGLGRPGVRAVVGATPAVIALVSCDPASMARDARLLAQAGYRAEGIALVDAFPHTPHVETVARFVRDEAFT